MLLRSGVVAVSARIFPFGSRQAARIQSGRPRTSESRDDKKLDSLSLALESRREDST